MGGNSPAEVAHAVAIGLEKPMSAPSALAALSALSQSTRMDIFRLLVRREPDGLSAGAIAETLGCPHNTFSAHIAVLARGGLVTGTRDGRTITYRADVAGMRRLLIFLVDDCCEGHPELCELAKTPSADDCGCTPAALKDKRRKRP